MQVDSNGRDLVDIASRLNSAAIHLLRSISRGDTSGGLTAARLSALSVIVYAGPISMSGLAAAEGVQLPTMSRLVASLEAEGYVRRHHDPDDRRSVQVAATERGAALLEEARQRRIATLAEGLRRLDASDLAALDRAATLIEEIVGNARPTRIS